MLWCVIGTLEDGGRGLNVGRRSTCNNREASPISIVLRSNGRGGHLGVPTRLSLGRKHFSDDVACWRNYISEISSTRCCYKTI